MDERDSVIGYPLADTLKKHIIHCRCGNENGGYDLLYNIYTEVYAEREQYLTLLGELTCRQEDLVSIGTIGLIKAVSGSRILGNQVLNYSYGEGNDFSLNQSSRKEVVLDLPKDFTPDENLLGTWVFQYFGYDIYKVTFNDNGSIKLQFLQDGITYNGTYTVEGDNINFTHYVADSVATQLPYTVDV